MSNPTLLEEIRRCRHRERQAAESAYNWCSTAPDTSWEAFTQWRRTAYPQPRRERMSALESPEVSPEPTPEAVAAFNARQLEFRRVYLMGYAEVLPEHRAEGVIKAAERFPLKRLVEAEADDPEGLGRWRISGNRLFFQYRDPETNLRGAWEVIEKNCVMASHPALTLTRLRGLAPLLDAAPRVEDVPIEEEEGV